MGEERDGGLDAVKPARPGRFAEQARGGYDVRSGRRYASMKIRDVIRAVEADGRGERRTRGSHRQFKHPAKPGKATNAGKLGDDMVVRQI